MNIILIIVGSLVGLFILMVAYSYYKLKRAPVVANSAKVMVLNDNNFKQQTKSGLVLVDFWAEWCMPCRMMNPIINQLADELDGEVKVGKLNIENSQSTASRLRVKNIPTMLVFKYGKEVSRIVGAKSKDQILSKLEQFR